MSSHEGPKSTPVDLQVLQMLAELQEPGEPDVLRELVTMFLRDTPERIDALRDAVAAGDLVTASRAAHSLKGSAASLGAGTLERLAADAEARGRQQDTVALATTVPALELEFAAVRRQLEDLLSSRPH